MKFYWNVSYRKELTSLSMVKQVIHGKRSTKCFLQANVKPWRRKRDEGTSVIMNSKMQMKTQDDEVSLLPTHKQTQLDDNIQSRREAQAMRAVTSLDTKDGVAGEFFECKRVASAEHSTTWPWSKIWTDLDHTADVQLHAWGGSFKESLQHMSQCLSNFVTDLSTVLVEPSQSIIFTVQGHDPQSMLYNFMDELLFRFSAEGFCCAKVKVVLDRLNNSLDVTA